MPRSKKKISRFKILVKLLRYTWQASPLTFIGLVLSSLLLSSLSFIEILTLEALFSSAMNITNGMSIEFVYRPMIFLLVVLALYPIAEWLEFLAQGYFWRRSSGYLKFLHHERINQMKAIEFEDTNHIDDLEKTKLGSEDAPDGIRLITQILFLYIPFFVVSLTYLISIKLELVFVMILIFIPTLILELIRMNNNFNFEDKIANQRRKMNYFESCITSKDYFKETLLNGSFEYFFKLFKESILKFSQEFRVVNRRLLLFSWIMKILNTIGYLSVIILLVYYVYTGVITIGLFAAIYYSISKITSMIKRLIDDVGQTLQGVAITSFLVEFLDSFEHVKSKETKLSKIDDIILKDVCFQYPNSSNQVLKNINIQIKSGTTLAIVGENGSGKSTLVKVLMGLYQPQQGTVHYGKELISKYKDESKFQRMSAVFQNFIKYKLSLEDNIRISDMHSEANITKTLSKIEVDLKKLNITPETILSREYGGQELSGGEWQRIAIARGLYKEHDLIVLDEPTAAIDPLEEAKVFGLFKKLSWNKTCVFVTHRLGSTKIADRIIVMEEGKIVEDGSHQDLMALGGKYYSLHKSQAEWYER